MGKILTGYSSLEEIEDEKQRANCHMDENGKIWLDQDSLISAFGKEKAFGKAVKNENIKLQGENEALKTQLEFMAGNNSEGKPEVKESNDKKDETPDFMESAAYKQMAQQMQALQSTVEASQAKNAQLELNTTLGQVETQCNLQPGMISLFKEDIGKDENGVFVKDESGQPKIDYLTGKRVSLAEHVLSQKTAKPYIFKQEAQGAGVGTGLNGKLNNFGLQAVDAKKIDEKIGEASKRGDAVEMMMLDLQKGAGNS